MRPFSPPMSLWGLPPTTDGGRSAPSLLFVSAAGPGGDVTFVYRLLHVFIIVSHKNSIAWNSSNLQPSVGGEKWIYDFSHLAFGWTILLSVTSISWTPESDNNNPPTEREAHAAHVACVTQPGKTLRLGYTQTPHWLQTPSITKTEAKLLFINACRPAYVHIWVASFNCQSMQSSPIGHRCAGGVAGFVFVCSPVDIFQI